MSGLRRPVSVLSAEVERLFADSGRRPLVMGIVNCTPDSFHSGGRTTDTNAAVGHALRMVQEGADIVDVGGESTRPGAERVPAEEQLRRVVPVIRGIRACSDVAVSVDTTRTAVALAAIEAGANIVNDVSAGLEDSGLLGTVAHMGAGLLLMHRRVPPGEDRYSDRHDRPPPYVDVVVEVAAFLAERASAAERAGVPRSRIAVDPGFGFGKSVEQNFAMLSRMGEFTALGMPVLAGLSRKSFLGAASGAPDPADRLSATLAAAVVAVRGGAAMLRVHDVAAHVQVRAVLRAAAGC